jgi:LysM repeat protein
MIPCFKEKNEPVANFFLNIPKAIYCLCRFMPSNTYILQKQVLMKRSGIRLISKIFLAAGIFAVAGNSTDFLFKRLNASSSKYSHDSIAAGAKAFHQVRKGDTLAKIAKEYLGNSRLWRKIADANPHVNPKKLHVGAKLYIPDLTNKRPFVENLSEAKEHERIVEAPMGSVKSDENTYKKPDYDFLDAILPEATELESKDSVSIEQEKSDYFVSEPEQNVSFFRGMEFELPENLKPEAVSSYFVNARGMHGLFNTESAFYPAVRTMNYGFHLRYDSYKESPYGAFNLSGSQWIMPFNILFLRNRLMVGATLPVQSWEVQRTDATQPGVSMTSLHDPSIRFGYQIWEDLEYEQAITLHFEARFPSGNYHQPKPDMTDKTRDSVQVGPAEATRGGWVQIGGAYSRRLAERWKAHFNLTLASDPRDKISRIRPTGSLEYSMADNCILLAELDASSWTMEEGPDGSNVDFLLGAAWFTSRWQFSLGVPVSVSNDWGYKHDVGLQLGINYRQD